MAFMAAIGPILGAVGSLVSGFAAMSAGNYQAKIAEMNAKIADDNARRAIERSQIEQQDQDTMTLGMLGEQEAAQSASGVSLTSKSSILTRKSARELGRRDALNVRQSGELEAYGFKTDAVNQRAQGQLAKMQGQSSMIGAFLGAGSSLIGAANGTPSRNRITKGTYDPWITKNGTNLRRVS